MKELLKIMFPAEFEVMDYVYGFVAIIALVGVCGLAEWMNSL